MELIAYILFFLAGLGFGYAVGNKLAWLALIFPVALAIGAALRDGISADVVLKLVLSLVLTVAGVLLGRWLLARGPDSRDSGHEPKPA